MTTANPKELGRVLMPDYTPPPRVALHNKTRPDILGLPPLTPPKSIMQEYQFQFEENLDEEGLLTSFNDIFNEMEPILLGELNFPLGYDSANLDLQLDSVEDAEHESMYYLHFSSDWNVHSQCSTGDRTGTASGTLPFTYKGSEIKFTIHDKPETRYSDDL
jgi:hypothetical protein